MKYKNHLFFTIIDKSKKKFDQQKEIFILLFYYK